MDIKYLTKRLVELSDELHCNVCTIEEMSELTKVLSKRIRKSRKFTKAKLTEEVAHVLMMVGVIVELYGLDEFEIMEEEKKGLQKGVEAWETGACN